MGTADENEGELVISSLGYVLRASKEKVKVLYVSKRALPRHIGGEVGSFIFNLKSKYQSSRL
jgi:hypothetical protein